MRQNYWLTYSILIHLLFHFLLLIGCGGGGVSSSNNPNGNTPQPLIPNTIQLPDYIPNLIITSPKNKFHTLSKTIKVEGQVENVTTLTLNGLAISITNNSFSHNFNLKNGKNELVFSALSPKGKSVTLKKTVYLGVYNIITLDLTSSLVYSTVSTLNNMPEIFSYNTELFQSQQISEGSQFTINKEPTLCPSKVAFISIDFLNSTNNSITNNNDPEIGFKNPALSPDCTKIAFSSNILDKTNWDIYTLEIKNPSNLQRISATPFNEDSPSWSSSGKKISFHSTLSNGISEIYIADIEKDPIVLQKIHSSSYHELNPDWAPTKDEIAFQVNSIATALSRSLSQPQSPNMEYNYSNIVKFNLSDNKPFSFTTGENNFVKPKWNKDGTKIGYINNKNGKICYRRVDNNKNEECFNIYADSFDW